MQPALQPEPAAISGLRPGDPAGGYLFIETILARGADEATIAAGHDYLYWFLPDWVCSSR